MQSRLVKNANALETASKNFFIRNGLDRFPKSLDEINLAFQKLRDGIAKSDLPALLIGKHIYENITAKEIRTLRVTAYNFEEFLRRFFTGKKLDKKSRKEKSEKVTGFARDYLRRVKRNALEKGDVVLGEVGLSAKTIVPKNLEINVGSFSVEVLFEEFLGRVPDQRGELGSRRDLKNVFGKIERKGKWNDFCRRFEQMVNSIFAYDWIIAIKGDKILDVYTMSRDDFCKSLVGALESGPDEAINYINRWELQAIRLPLEPWFEKCTHVKVKLLGRLPTALEKAYKTSDYIKVGVAEVLMGEREKETAIRELEEEIKELVELLRKNS